MNTLRILFVVVAFLSISPSFANDALENWCTVNNQWKAIDKIKVLQAFDHCPKQSIKPLEKNKFFINEAQSCYLNGAMVLIWRIQVTQNQTRYKLIMGAGVGSYGSSSSCSVDLQ